MIIKYRAEVVLAIITTLAIITLFLIESKTRNNDMDCFTEFSVIRKNGKLKAELSQFMDKGYGVVKLSGSISDEEAVKFIGIVVNFDYSVKGDEYFITTTSIQDSPGTNASIDEKKKWLPGFWLKEGGKITIRMEDINNNGWMIYARDMPMYFCHK